jgi:hypothetical protein
MQHARTTSNATTSQYADAALPCQTKHHEHEGVKQMQAGKAYQEHMLSDKLSMRVKDIIGTI